MTSNKNLRLLRSIDPYIHPCQIAFRFCWYQNPTPTFLYCFTLHLAIPFEHGAPPPPVSSALIFHFSSMHGHSHKDGISSSISVFLPFAYSSDKRVLLFVCVFFLFARETCLHLDLEGSAYFVLSLPAYSEYRFSFPLSFAMSPAAIYP